MCIDMRNYTVTEIPRFKKSLNIGEQLIMKSSVFAAILCVSLCALLVFRLGAEEPYILTPPASATPRINGPSVFGVRTNSPFQYNIPATGERPMTFTADGLPAGISLDPNTGRIIGKLQNPGEYSVN